MRKATCRRCIANGIAKVNFATELRIAYTQGIQQYLQENPKAIDPKKYSEIGRTAVKELVKARMQVCGCIGKAGKV